jgi:dihydroorotate dehydrogenase (fumarate)
VDKTCPGDGDLGSLNTLGYSPVPLSEYLSYIETLSKALKGGQPRKPVIISVTGTIEDVVECLRQISLAQKNISMPLAMEINLSCPNIPDKPPPAYSGSHLTGYLSALKTERLSQQARSEGNIPNIPIGIKVPPYTYTDQFSVLTTALLASATPDVESTAACPITFITATNTLGNSLLLRGSTSSDPVLLSADGSGMGGLGGAPLHPLALGNVYMLKKNLSSHPQLSHIQIIGVGGVEDRDGYLRMLHVGASAVGVGTALGRKGIDVFREITGGSIMT